MGKTNFDLTDLLNDATTAAAAPAGMQVVQLPINKLDKNPENAIYIVGDLDQLTEDIKTNGLRSPLEVIKQPGGRYMVLSGHRRLAACQSINDASFGTECKTVPCVIRESKGAAADTIDLITANATARELTDGERLDQCQALKKALTALKAEGKLAGRVRDEMSRILGESTGTLGRLNAIADNATEEVKQLLRDGVIGVVRAYEASKLHPRMQLTYATTGKVPTTPPLTDDQRKAVTLWMLTDSPAVPALKKYDYLHGESWTFAPGGCEGQVPVPVGDGEGVAYVTASSSGGYVHVSIADPADDTYTMHEDSIAWRDLYDRAKQRYWSKAEREAHAKATAAKAAAKKAADEWLSEVRDALEGMDGWAVENGCPGDMCFMGLGLYLYSRHLSDGGKLWRLCADQLDGGVKNMGYARTNAAGERVKLSDLRNWQQDWPDWLSDVDLDELGPLLGMEADNEKD